MKKLGKIATFMLMVMLLGCIQSDLTRPITEIKSFKDECWYRTEGSNQGFFAPCGRWQIGDVLAK